MKKSLQTVIRRAGVLCAGLVLAMVGNSFGQATGNVTLTVNLVDILALTVGQGAVTLDFNSATAYQNGLTAQVNNQLVITSNRSYDLKVKAASANLISGANTISVSKISVQPFNTTGIGTVTPVTALSTADQTLAAAAPATILKNISLQYSTAAGEAEFLKPAGNYTVTLTYTATAL